MNLEESSFGQASVVAATGLSAPALQAWVARGVLSLSLDCQKPGTGNKRLYSGMEVARIAAMKVLTDLGVS